MDVKTKIITQFVKDLSFENPNGPGSFKSGGEKPKINANVDVKAQNRKDTNIYEVELNIILHLFTLRSGRLSSFLISIGLSITAKILFAAAQPW